MSPRRPLLAGALLAILACNGDAPPPTGLQVPTALSLSSGALSFNALDQTLQLTATVLDRDGSAIPDAVVTWTTSSAVVAEVSPAGLVIATGPGTAWIRASSGELRDSASVSVQQEPSAIAFSPAALRLAGPGDTATVAASVLDAGGSAITGAQVTWSSLDEEVATIDDAGFVTGVATGATSLRAELATSAQPLAGTVDVAIDDGVATGPSGGDVEAGDGMVHLHFPPGALGGLVFVGVEPAGGLGTHTPAVPGAAFAFSPDGIVFGAPVTLTIAYDPALIPVGIPEGDLRLHEFVNGRWIAVPGSTVDTGAHSASGAIGGFSVYAVVQKLTVATTALGHGIQSAPYPLQSLTAVGGNAGLTWSVIAGSLPSGLVLSPSGSVTGTPTGSGSSTFTVQVSDGSHTAVKTLSITVYPTLAVTTTSLPNGLPNVPYAATLIASGDDGSYAWLLVGSALPAGLSLSTSGSITGTATTPGTSTFTVQVTGGLGQTAQRSLSITVTTDLTVFTGSLPDGIEGQGYQAQALVATGGDGSYAWTLVGGALPDGLDLSGDGTVSGVPTSIGTASFTVEVMSGGQVATRNLSITVDPLLAITTASLPDGVQGTGYGPRALAAVGGQGGYGWSVVAGVLPPGLSLSAGGAITGTPTASGTTDFTVRVTSGSQPAERALSITVHAPLAITTTFLPDGVQDGDYAAPLLAATGGTGSYAWSIASGSLPAGLDLSAGGAVTGTPEADGTFNFAVEVASGTQTTQQPLSITVIPALQVTTTSLSDGVAGEDYGTHWLTATGGTGGYTWSVVSGSLPSGLSLSSAGDITGTPTASGIANFTVQVASGIQTDEQDLSITIVGDPAALSIEDPQPSTSAQSGVPLLNQPRVAVRDGANNLLTGFDVTATIESGGGTLGGTTTVTTNGSGLAIFTDLVLTGIVGERTLRFTSEAASIVSGPVLLTAGVPASVFIDTQPPASEISGETLSQQPVVQVSDGAGNVVPFVDVDASLQGAGSLGGNTTATTNGSGVATFSGLSIDGGPGARTLRFTSGGADVTSTSVHLSYSVGFHPDLESFCAGQLMDVSVPIAAFPRPLPVVGFIHGGGWTSGDQKLGLLLEQVRNEMLSRGYVVVSMTYRKAEELGNRWPTQIHDVKCVIRHMRSLADDYGVDGGRIGVWGSSAGGHLASMLGVTDADDAGGALEGGDIPGWSTRVRAAVAIGGVSDVRPDDGAQSELNFFGPEWTFDTWPGPSQELIDASPVTWATSDDPPFLVIHGTADTTVEYHQAERLATALGNAGGDVTLRPVTNGGHNLNDVGAGPPSLSLAEVTEIIADFFDDHVK